MNTSKKIRIALSAVAFIIAIGIIVYLPPDNVTLIMGFVAAVTIGGFLLSSAFLGYVRAFLIALFISLFLFMSIFIGFQVLNTILLLCFIIGLDRVYSSFK